MTLVNQVEPGVRRVRPRSLMTTPRVQEQAHQSVSIPAHDVDPDLFKIEGVNWVSGEVTIYEAAPSEASLTMYGDFKGTRITLKQGVLSPADGLGRLTKSSVKEFYTKSLGWTTVPQNLAKAGGNSFGNYLTYPIFPVGAEIPDMALSEDMAL